MALENRIRSEQSNVGPTKFADYFPAADKFGDGDWRGGMDGAGEGIAPPPAEQTIHFDRGVEVAAEAKTPPSLSSVDA